MFLLFYWIMTLIHALHVTIGIVRRVGDLARWPAPAFFGRLLHAGRRVGAVLAFCRYRVDFLAADVCTFWVAHPADIERENLRCRLNSGLFRGTYAAVLLALIVLTIATVALSFVPCVANGTWSAGWGSPS